MNSSQIPVRQRDDGDVDDADVASPVAVASLAAVAALGNPLVGIPASCADTKPAAVANPSAAVAAVGASAEQAVVAFQALAGNTGSQTVGNKVHLIHWVIVVVTHSVIPYLLSECERVE